ncbi:L,D-transpeptidase [Sphingobacterium gobiense]|nr:L,D-transpeptidase [Sphingobacterium gobiense]
MRYVFLFLAVVFYSSCRDRTSETKKDTPPELPDTRLLISISQRQLYAIEGDDTIKRYAISVGKQGHPTPQGDFEIHQIDWNPDWTPPDSEWAQDERYKRPGQSGNPMGRARIIYKMPYTIHGTTDLESLGEAESHGSVRMANTDVIELGRFLMERTGTKRSQEWFNQVLSDSTTMESVKLEQSIPLTNVE